MLKITKKTEYALIAIRHIEDNKILVSSNDIAKQYDIPRELMAKAGYLKAIKGPNGGYKSQISLENISLREFMESIEGPLGLIDCYTSKDCKQINACNIKDPIKRINSSLLNFLDNISLVEITR